MTHTYSHSFGLLACAAAASFIASGGAAMASITISGGTTTNMSCSSGVCSATASKAVLNAASVEAMLAAGDLTIETGTKTTDIIVASKLTWSNASTLELSAKSSIVVNAVVTAKGAGGMTLTTGKGGGLSFGTKGSIDFRKTTSALSINGVAYELVGTLPDLITSVADSPSGAVALTANYDAKPDGIYAHSPVSAEFTGIFEGLGHTISNLTITDTSADVGVGLFQYVYPGGVLENLHLTNANVTTMNATEVATLVGVTAGAVSGVTVTGSVAVGAGQGKSAIAAGMVGDVESSKSFTGTISGASANTTVMLTGGGTGGMVGGLVGRNDGGMIMASGAAGSVTGDYNVIIGGLAGSSSTGSVISESYSTATVSTGDPSGLTFGEVGGLVGSNGGTIENCYETGAAGGGGGVWAGGLLGAVTSGSMVENSYATGAITGFTDDGNNADLGGVVGNNSGSGSFVDTYWDTSTSGVTMGAGFGTQAGTGETTAELAAGLPAGFSSKVWEEKASVLGGLPYLKANPPAR